MWINPHGWYTPIISHDKRKVKGIKRLLQSSSALIKAWDNEIKSHDYEYQYHRRATRRVMMASSDSCLPCLQQPTSATFLYTSPINPKSSNRRHRIHSQWQNLSYSDVFDVPMFSSLWTFFCFGSQTKLYIYIADRWHIIDRTRKYELGRKKT